MRICLKRFCLGGVLPKKFISSKLTQKFQDIIIFLSAINILMVIVKCLMVNVDISTVKD